MTLHLFDRMRKLVPLALLFAVSCDDTSTNAPQDLGHVTFTIEWSSGTSSFDFDADYALPFEGVTYSRSSRMTACRFSDRTQQAPWQSTIMFGFPGQAPGTFPIDGIRLPMHVRQATQSFAIDLVSIPDSIAGTITVASYGSVGEFVTGSFDGYVSEVGAPDSLRGHIIGNFIAVRNPDFGTTGWVD